MLWMVVLPALAQDEPDETVPAEEEAPEEETLAPPPSGPPPIKKVIPTYPGVRPEGDVRCRVAIQVGTDGVPKVMGVSVCEEPFAGSARAAMEQWRYAPHETGFITTNTVVFRRGEGSMADAMSHEQFLAVLHAHQELEPTRAADGPCRIRVGVDPEGSVVDLRSNEVPTCMLVPGGGAKPSGKVWKSFEGASASCALRFQPTATGLTGLTASTCDAALIKPTEKLARGWSYNVLPGGTPYELEVVYTR